MSHNRILIAGIGNIFLGDDAFGVEVAQRLLKRPEREGVTVVDFGIRGIDLTYALMDGYETVIMIDAAPRGGTPGTLYLIEPELHANDENMPQPVSLETHNLDPAKVLEMVGTLGGTVGRVFLVGCEPAPADADVDPQMELSKPVRHAIDEAVRMVDELVEKLLAERDADTSVRADTTNS